MNKVVLDASALLAVMFNERGAEVVAPVLFGATISAVNYSEVFKKAIEKRGTIQETLSFLTRQAIRIVSFDQERAIAAAAILPQSAEHGLSFADRACVALGLELGYRVFTAEERMSKTTLAIDVRLIRQRVSH